MNTNNGVTINTKLFQCNATTEIGWLRIFGFGFRWKDLRKHQLVFSERYGYTKHFEFGHWSFAWLMPNGEVRGASRPAGEASSAEGATSTVVLERCQQLRMNMTREDLIALAKKAGFTIEAGKRDGVLIILGDGGLYEGVLREFAQLVAAEEREACAKVCDELKDNKEFPEGWGPVSKACARLIRERSNGEVKAAGR